jgi:thiosulfate/3-mercaptopyruvate sulfurtransferase
VEPGVVELEKTRSELTPNPEAVVALWELPRDDPNAVVVDVRREEEYSGKGGYPCDPRQGHVPGARNVEVSTLFSAPGVPKPAAEVQTLVGIEPDGKRLITYCHSGSRSGLAVVALRAAGYDARNYFGSWHEYSRHEELPIER